MSDISRKNKFQIFFCDFDKAHDCGDWCGAAVCDFEGWEKSCDVKRDFFIEVIFKGGDPSREFAHFFFAVVFVGDD